MRRFALLIFMVLAVTACSGDTADTTTTTEPTTTTDTSAPTTIQASTTTTTAPDRTTVPEEFVTTEGTPPDVFESFAGEMTMSMALGEVTIDLTSTGIWTDDAFSCVASSGLGGISFEETVVATISQLWIDSGNGFDESNLFAPTAQEIMGSCPTSPLFWAGFGGEEFGTITGEEDLIDGRPAVKADLAGLIKELGGLGIMGGFEGATINDLIMWFDVETNAIIAMNADMEMSDEMMSEFGADGTGPIGILMRFELTQINDPSLVVELP